MILSLYQEYNNKISAFKLGKIMDFNHWDKIFSSKNAQSNKGMGNVIGRIKGKLKKQNKSIHQNWRKRNMQ
jgi:hypothetical protein